MDSPRPILPAELEFFNKGTGKGNFNILVIQLNKYHLHSSFGGSIHQVW